MDVDTHRQAAREKRSRSYYRNLIGEAERDARKKRVRIAAVKQYLAEHLSKHPCLDCGETDPIVLDFDHRDPREKIFRISQARQGRYVIGRVIEEVAECDVRCANCHRRRTHIQQQAGEIRNGLRYLSEG